MWFDIQDYLELISCWHYGSHIYISPRDYRKRSTKGANCTNQIKGLCVGVGGVNVGEQQYGIIIFMRGENAMDKKGYKFYRDEILVPFILKTRAEYGE